LIVVDALVGLAALMAILVYFLARREEEAEFVDAGKGGRCILLDRVAGQPGRGLVGSLFLSGRSQGNRRLLKLEPHILPILFGPTHFCGSHVGYRSTPAGGQHTGIV